ncbi:hypothetical protein KM1_086070 [Entamoeba histolytica HM-3:IMSS]|uniref:Uncharacterized protein n=1 Tax=Entamoeba histolytica HM-3:IMSS TaxID=885315 RepID=M7X9E1_ENTHI|nr:hypothetical protein KM1_086070 [Entamoeba histolytica HM-3:IMSS]
MTNPFTDVDINSFKINRSIASSEEKKPKRHSLKYSVEAEKKFPKIRISQKDYNRLKDIQERLHCKSFGQVVIRLLNCYKQQITTIENQMYVQQH